MSNRIIVFFLFTFCIITSFAQSIQPVSDSVFVIEAFHAKKSLVTHIYAYDGILFSLKSDSANPVVYEDMIQKIDENGVWLSDTLLPISAFSMISSISYRKATNAIGWTKIGIGTLLTGAGVALFFSKPEIIEKNNLLNVTIKTIPILIGVPIIINGIKMLSNNKGHHVSKSWELKILKTKRLTSDENPVPSKN